MNIFTAAYRSSSQVTSIMHVSVNNTTPVKQSQLIASYDEYQVH
jgi:hypothetical protein